MRNLESPRDLPDARGRLAAAIPRLAHTIGRCDLYWVTAEMSAVALDASHDLPAWTAATAWPSPRGMLHWRGGTLPPIVVSGTSLDLAGILWAPVGDDRVQVNLLGLTRQMAQTLQVDLAMSPPLGPIASLTLPLWQEAAPDDLRPAFDDAAGITAFIGATWILMQQPRVAHQTLHRPGRRDLAKAARAGAADPFVTSVSLRPMRSLTTERASSGRRLTVRHMVRGHWRQQYHPSDRSRRPRWIASYLKGPADAPLRLTTPVMVWRR